MGMHGYMSFHVCRSWKITFSSRFFPFMLLNQGLYCTVSLGPFSLSDYILLFFISLFSIYLFLLLLLLFLHFDHVFSPFSLPFPHQAPLPSTPPPLLSTGYQPAMEYQATVVSWWHIKVLPLLLRLEEVAQKEEMGPKAAKRVIDRLYSFCYEFHKRTKLHNCNTYAEVLSFWFLF